MRSAKAYSTGNGGYTLPNVVPTDLVTITPADADLAEPIMGLHVGGGGNVRVTTLDGTDCILYNVGTGATIALGIKRVWATNTTATLMAGYL